MDRLGGSISLIGGIDGGIRGSVPVNGKIERPETVYVRELRFSNHYEFPNVGDPLCLYIAVDENKIFHYDENTHTYNCVGSNYEDIDAIQCQLKED